MLVKVCCEEVGESVQHGLVRGPVVKVLNRWLGKSSSLLCGWCCSVGSSQFVVGVVVQIQGLVERNQVEVSADNVLHFHVM